MSRIDIIQKALPSHTFINLCDRGSDDELMEQFDSLPHDEQQHLVQLATPDTRSLNADKAADVQRVAQSLAYRLIGTEHLPLMLRRILLFANDNDSADLLLLSTLTSASAYMPHYVGSFWDECIQPPLYTLISGNAASGKGKAKLCMKMVEAVEAIRPTLIPGNSSATAIYENLNEYEGHGFIFETETDTLSQAFKIGGSFSDGLCKAFQGERVSYRRRTNHEFVNIPHPELAILLTGTPAQLGRLFPSGAENGLFSRFCHYRLHNQEESFVENAIMRAGISSIMIGNYMEALGAELKQIFLAFERHPGVTFELTTDQNRLFLAQFYDIARAYKELVGMAYQDEEAENQMTSICNRMGNICFRILMIVCAIRAIEQGGLTEKICCCDDDLHLVGLWGEVLMHHSLIHFDDLAMILGYVEDEEQEPDLGSPDLLNEQQRQLWDALPKYFIKKDAILVAQKLEVPPSTLSRYLSLFCDLGTLSRRSRGLYRKN